MSQQTIKTGTRKLRKTTSGFAINFPKVLVESFDLAAGDIFDISATDPESIILKRVDR